MLIAYNKFVKPAYDEFIKPTINKADIIIPRGVQNKIAINAVIDVIQSEISKRKNFEEKAKVEIDQLSDQVTM